MHFAATRRECPRESRRWCSLHPAASIFGETTAPTQRGPAFRYPSLHCPSGRKSPPCNLQNSPSPEQGRISRPASAALSSRSHPPESCIPAARLPDAPHRREANCRGSRAQLGIAASGLVSERAEGARDRSVFVVAVPRPSQSWRECSPPSLAKNSHPVSLLRTPIAVSGQAKPSTVSVSGGSAIFPAAIRCAALARTTGSDTTGWHRGVTLCSLTIGGKMRTAVATRRLEINRTRHNIHVSLILVFRERNQGRLTEALYPPTPPKTRPLEECRARLSQLRLPC